MRLLIVEDDASGASYLVRGLTESGHIVDHVADGALGLAMAQEGIYDLIVLDRRLPQIDGIAIVRQLRADLQTVPVLMLSAIAGMRDRVEGMQAGCDDYLVKPYAFAELLARVEAIGRRADRSRRSALLTVGDLVLDVTARRAERAGMLIALRHREFLLLEVLMRNAGSIVTRSMLLEAAWHYDFEPLGSVVDRHIYRLRQKIDDGHQRKLIRTVRGAGYLLEAEALPGPST